MDFDKCLMSCIYLYNILQNNLTSLKNPHVLLNSPTLKETTTDLYCLCIFTFSKILPNWNPTIYSFFRLPYFTKQYAFKMGPCFFSWFDSSHFFLSLSNIPLYGHTCLSVHLLKGILVASSFYNNT